MRRWESLLAGALLLATLPSGLRAATLPEALSTPAPVPDLDITQPKQNGGPPHASLRPGLSRPDFGTTATSQGFTPGSSYSDMFDGHFFRVMPTLRLNVPFQ